MLMKFALRTSMVALRVGHALSVVMCGGANCQWGTCGNHAQCFSLCHLSTQANLLVIGGSQLALCVG